MSNTFTSLTDLDATIARGLDAAGLLDTATVAGVNVEGYFNQSLETAGPGDEEYTFRAQTFDCRADDWPAGVSIDDPVVIAGAGTFRFMYKQEIGVGRLLVTLGDSDG